MEKRFSKSLHIRDKRKSQCASDNSNGVGDSKAKKSDKSNKVADFPYPDMDLPPNSSDEEEDEDDKEETEEVDGDEEDEEEEEADGSVQEYLSDDVSDEDEYYYSPSVSLPSAENLVSAMKGSREKRGLAAPSKLSVTWAPEVYDPEPDSIYKGRKLLKIKKSEKIEKHVNKGQKSEKKVQKVEKKGSGKVKKQYNRHRGGRGGSDSDIAYI